MNVGEFDHIWSTEVFFLTQNPIEQNNSAQFYRFWIALDMQVFYFFKSLEQSMNKIKCITNTNLCVRDKKNYVPEMKIYVLQREETVHTKVSDDMMWGGRLKCPNQGEEEEE